MFEYSINGIKLALHKSKLPILLFFMFITLVLSYLLKISHYEISMILILSAMLMSLEMLNTSVELVCDLVEPNQNPKVKEIKDISSGAVFVFTISTFIVGCIVFIPKLMVYLKWM